MEAIMKDTYISEAVKYIGADDTTLDLFESQYQIPNGVSYNSYVLPDEFRYRSVLPFFVIFFLHDNNVFSGKAYVPFCILI